jgi:Cu/Ag efflux pump CusA
MQFPLEYHARVLGEYALPQAARTRLLTLAITAAIGILFLLHAASGSWRLAALSFLTLPTALVGGLLAALATGGVVSLGSFAGLFVVFGVAASNNLMLIRRYQHLERHEGEPFGPKLVLRGARERLSPILMATFATGLALVPALFLGDVPGLEIVRPMAIVVLGGLVTSGVLDLYFLPALFFSLGVSAVQELDLSAAEAREAVFGDVSAAPGMATGD